MRFLPASIGFCAILLGCGEGADEPADETAPAADSAAVAEAEAAAAAAATAVVRDASGAELGTLTLTETGAGVEITGGLTGLPEGEHGFHVHQTGSCEPPTFASAATHATAPGAAHGFDAEGGPHLGDLWNVVAGAEGTAQVDQTNDRMTLRDGTNALLDADGSALVLHAGPDDYATQPSGGSGDPIACGVVEG